MIHADSGRRRPFVFIESRRERERERELSREKGLVGDEPPFPWMTVIYTSTPQCRRRVGPRRVEGKVGERETVGERQKRDTSGAD